MFSSEKPLSLVETLEMRFRAEAILWIFPLWILSTGDECCLFSKSIFLVLVVLLRLEERDANEVLETRGDEEVLESDFALTPDSVPPSFGETLADKRCFLAILVFVFFLRSHMYPKTPHTTAIVVPKATKPTKTGDPEKFVGVAVLPPPPPPPPPNPLF